MVIVSHQNPISISDQYKKKKMKNIGKLTREDILTLPNKKELLEERIKWLKKQRKKDKIKVRKKHSREMRALGYIHTRELQSCTITISKYNHLTFTVREIKSGEIVVNNRFYQYESKRGKK